MQNSGLATPLASSSFPSLALAAVPGALLAGYFSKEAETESD
ncbi:hypothetical protein TALC_01126 [Thermoplasmatales archaeon BRNA1]|nr:hypothetical protein TALC_01126 [Thermoplasmatales archaeon BRNA1]